MITVRLLLLLAIVPVMTGVRPMTPVPARPVETIRLPTGAIQPQLANDSKGRWHAIYFKGDAAAGDIFYLTISDAGAFSTPIRVNDRPGAALATGNVRGAHLAIGKDDRVHVAWVGSTASRPSDARDRPLMFYTRASTTANTAFEPARNLAQSSIGLDGGDLAADASGHVFVVWHGEPPGFKGEEGRHLFIARSSDDGRTFAAETAADDGTMGACGCCGTRSLAVGTDLFVLFRSATDTVHRDTFLLTSRDHGQRFTSRRLDEWNVGACPMSTFSLAADGATVLAAWESEGHVRWTRIDRATGAVSALVTAPIGTANQKHPAIAANNRGEIALVWTEGMAWSKGGDVVWQLYDRSGSPTAEHGRTSGVPPWSLVAVRFQADGTFKIVY